MTVLNDETAARVLATLKVHQGEAVLVQLVHEEGICCCGLGQGITLIWCTCNLRIILHELPGRVADVIEPQMLRALKG